MNPAEQPSGARLNRVWHATSDRVVDYVTREFNTSTGLAASFWYMLGSAMADGRHHDWKRVAWELPVAAGFKLASQWKAKRELKEDRLRFPEAFAEFARHEIHVALDHFKFKKHAHADSREK